MSDDTTPSITFKRTDILSALQDAWGVTIPPIKADFSGFETESFGDKVGDAIAHSILEDYMPTEVVTFDDLDQLVGLLEQLTGDLERVTDKVRRIMAIAEATSEDGEDGEGTEDAVVPAGTDTVFLFAGQGGATG